MGSATSLPLEISVAPGDSGGPVFFTENGNRVVAGINSFIYGLPVALGGDGTDNASYSDLQGYLRISMFNDWIDEVTGQTVPEPAGLLMVLMAPMLLGRRYRREADL
jgi:secreted trypsin-like serine protease